MKLTNLSEFYLRKFLTSLRDMYMGIALVHSKMDSNLIHSSPVASNFENRLSFYAKNILYVDSFLKTGFLEKNKDFLGWILFELERSNAVFNSIPPEEISHIMRETNKTQEEIIDMMLDGHINHINMQKEVSTLIHEII